MGRVLIRTSLSRCEPQWVTLKGGVDFARSASAWSITYDRAEATRLEEEDAVAWILRNRDDSDERRASVGLEPRRFWTEPTR